MITEKSKNILRRAVSYLYTLKAYADLKDKTLIDRHAEETLEELAMEQIRRLTPVKKLTVTEYIDMIGGGDA